MEPLPEPYNEIRQLHLDYGRRYDEIQARTDIDAGRKSELAGELWFQTNKRLKALRKSLPKRQQCTAITKAGTRCTKYATPDYIGQRCAAHVPHLSDW